MPHIQQLDSHVADLIAAGEVVERPASVVKELVENAVDAGASSVTVEIQHGGMTLIRVTDDGCGIAPDEAETAFLRHATSKIRSERDLEAIGTLGFRGEALAAISAVSRVSLLTRTPDAPLGISLSLEGGVITEREEAGCPSGTTRVVRDLFYNTPARLKFMKKDAAEGAAVFATVQRLALSHPEVGIKFLRDGRQELLTPGDGDLSSVVYSVLGREIALGLLPVKGSGEEMAVSGFTCLPACCRGTRGYQHFFVNGRYVKSRTMTAAVEEAYRNQKMVGKFPSCVLYLTTRLSAVDVNVHPTKQEVKFTHERRVFDTVYYAVKSTLERELPHPAATLEERQAPADPPVRQPSSRPAPYPPTPVPATGQSGGLTLHDCTAPASIRPNLGRTPTPSPPSHVNLTGDVPSSSAAHQTVSPAPQRLPEQPPLVQEQLVQVQPLRREEPAAPPPPSKPTAPGAEEMQEVQEPLEDQEVTPWRVVGEAFHTYILVEQGDQLLLIDKHAAHERMNFDALKAEGYTPMVQYLLTPVVFTPPAEEGEALLSHQDLLEGFGFELGDFGGGALIVRQAPDYVDPGEIQSTLTELAGKLLTHRRADPADARDELLHSMACKAAIKGGQKNGPEELHRVAQAVLSGAVKYCPHGRPVAITLTRGQLEKQFKRA